MQRAPAFAGRLYPDDPDDLSRAVRARLDPATAAIPARFLVTPGDALERCGAVLGAAYARIRVPEVVVLLGAVPPGDGPRIAIWPTGTWEVPGRRLDVDAALAHELRDAAMLVDDPRPFTRAASLEVQLPFVSLRNPAARIVPVALGDLPRETTVRVGNALADVLRAVNATADVLVVASAWLVAAGEAPAPASAAAVGAVAAALRLDPAHLASAAREDGLTLEGLPALEVALEAARALGADHGELLRYAAADARGYFGIAVA
jgi:AmmeMemoRadiSam system protein B